MTLQQSPTSLLTLPPGPGQDRIIAGVNGELQSKGFVVAQMDKLLDWARTGSLWRCGVNTVS